VPRVLVWDGEGAIGRWRAGKPELTAECQAFRGTLGARVVVCRPADPEAKGLVERANGYLETSFLPGRRFASPADFNAQLAEWTATVNGRVRRALGCAPADRIAADRHAMLSLPPVAPETGWRSGLRLPRDHYVRLDANDYSVHPAVIGRRIEVIAGLDRVRAFCGGQLVADHERAWAWHQVITDPEHKAAAAGLRRARVGVLRPAPEPEVEQRSLDVYDALTGGDGGAA
jgi:transposase